VGELRVKSEEFSAREKLFTLNSYTFTLTLFALPRSTHKIMDKKRVNILSEKNPTPRQIGVYMAMILSVVILIAMSMIHLISDGQFRWWHIGLITVLIFGVAYGINIIALERFIYRRVKLIYKTIHNMKAPKGSKVKKMNMDLHLIDEVEEEVTNWAKERDKEIENLKKLEAYRRDFLGNVSHELKTPIFNVQGYIETLIESKLEDEAINMPYLKRAAKNVERLSTITQDLDMIAQLESEDLHLDIQHFDIHELAREIFDEMSITAREKHIGFSFKQGCDKAFIVEGDRERIRQVFVNLITNSVKYGKVEGNTKVGFYEMDDKHLLIEISDDGYGIEEKHLPRLFERFYRIDKSRSREQGGSGLGLAIVKHIVEAHKQTVTVRSTLNVGSTFGFTLQKV